MTVLLGDTDTDSLARLADDLRREGFTVITVPDGEQALRLCQTDHPDIVVLATDLPRISGFDVCRWIREQGSTPVILLSTVDTYEERVQGFRAGADGWVTKPCGPAELAARIRAVWQQAVGDLTL